MVVKYSSNRQFQNELGTQIAAWNLGGGARSGRSERDWRRKIFKN